MNNTRNTFNMTQRDGSINSVLVSYVTGEDSRVAKASTKAELVEILKDILEEGAFQKKTLVKFKELMRNVEAAPSEKYDKNLKRAKQIIYYFFLAGEGLGVFKTR